MNHASRAQIESPLIAAAMMVARHVEYSVRVVLPGASDPRVLAETAAETAGVDVVVAQGASQTSVQFVARHQDRRVTRRQLGASVRTMTVGNAPPVSKLKSRRLVDVGAFRSASEALALNQRQDPEVELIWRCLLRAGASAHSCGGIPTLVLNDVHGLVGILRRRARMLGVTMRINPDACACH
jgi:hypothetical protein